MYIFKPSHKFCVYGRLIKIDVLVVLHGSIECAYYP